MGGGGGGMKEGDIFSNVVCEFIIFLQDCRFNSETSEKK